MNDLPPNPTRMKLPFYLLIMTAALSSLPAGAQTLWIGTGGANAKGIYRATFDPTKGKLSEPVVATEIDSPGFVALNEARTRLYSLSKEDSGSVVAFSLDADQNLARQNASATGDGGASHLSLDHTGKLLFSAQYGGGSVSIYRLAADGWIAARTQVIEHEGQLGPNQKRQDAPHPHWTGVSPDNRFLLVPDLGLDQVVIYRIDHETATMAKQGAGILPPGSGPRHLKFSKDGSKIYCLNELKMTVTVFAWDAGAGTMTEIQTIETLPESEWKIETKASEIRVHPTGRFVYAANRGHDSISVFSVDPQSGKLAFVERESVRGAYPRNFNLDPTGGWLLAAGRVSNTIAIFRIDPETGRLYFMMDVVNAPSPICLEF